MRLGLRKLGEEDVWPIELGFDGVMAQLGNLVWIPRSDVLVVYIVGTSIRIFIVEHNLNLHLLKLPVPYSSHRRDLLEDCQLPASGRFVNTTLMLLWDASLYLLHSLHDIFSVCRVRVGIPFLFEFPHNLSYQPLLVLVSA